MANYVISFLIFIFLLVRSGLCDSSYTGSVVEFVPETEYGLTTKEEANKLISKNLNNYEPFLQEANLKNSQIAVFPEYGVYGYPFTNRASVYPYLEEITVFDTPCTNSSLSNFAAITKTSCLAIKYNTYIVIDIADEVKCSPQNDKYCPKDLHYQYNTAVAFAPNGTIIQKYHKSHLYGSESFFWNAGLPEAKYFDTNFGVRFGMFICFDIFWQKPEVLAIQEFGITDFVYPTLWVNNSPKPIFAVEIQQGWSRKFESNILAANMGLSYKTSGSGIYSKGKILEYFFNPTDNPVSKLITSKIPILNSKPKIKVDTYDNEPSGSRIIKTFTPKTGESGTLELKASENFTCRVSYTVDSSLQNQTFGTNFQKLELTGNFFEIDKNSNIISTAQSSNFKLFDKEGLIVSGQEVSLNSSKNLVNLLQLAKVGPL